MDPAKIRAVVDWPTSLRLVQNFLGFANIFRCFVRNISSMAAHLTALMWKTPGPFCWTSEAQNAFEEIKAWPGSKNTKPDDLSRQWVPPGPDPSPESIIPTPRILTPLCWELENAIREALQQEPDPGGGPLGKLYVPGAVQQWGHASPFSGFLHLLPIPAHPWSHISLDFVKGLIPYKVTVILLLMDCFSKACKFLALPKLPSAKETAELLFQHMVRINGMPCDLVSDRGPQFASHFWKAFCWFMGASVSLSSVFHPREQWSD
ncbi:hypothetical protein AOLI_G00099930 [Acnodon oligacanthus]